MNLMFDDVLELKKGLMETSVGQLQTRMNKKKIPAEQTGETSAALIFFSSSPPDQSNESTYFFMDR